MRTALATLMVFIGIILVPAPAQANTDFDYNRWGGDPQHHALGMMVRWERLSGGGLRVNNFVIDCENPRSYGRPAMQGIRAKLTAANGDSLWERTGNGADVDGDCYRIFDVDQSFPNREKIEVFYSGVNNHVYPHTEHNVEAKKLLVTIS